VRPDEPGGCSTTFGVSGGAVTDPRAVGKHLWVVLERYPDPAGGPHALFYAKQPVSTTFSFSKAANTDPDARRYRFLLVAADDGANGQLEINFESDRDQDKSKYTDAQRVQLPTGSTEIATTPDFPQKC
jgi:hypothetical protein